MAKRECGAVREMKARTTSDLPFAIGIPALVWQLLFFYLPLLLIICSSFIRLTTEGQFEGLTFDHFLHFFSPVYLKVIGSSLLLALSNALICFLIGYPLAYYIAFPGRKQKNLLLFLLVVPFWTNFLLHVYAWFYVLDRGGLINSLLLWTGIIREPLHLLNSLSAILVMMVYYYLPFMVMPLYTALEKFNYSLIEASQDLGATWITTLRRVLLPLTNRGILAGFFLVFIPSFAEFAIPELMGGDRLMFVGNVVSQYILGEGTGSLGAAFTLFSSLFLLSASLLLYFFINWLLKGRRIHG